MNAPTVTTTPDGARALLERNWREVGYASPNLETYPWQWLWDSCFHVLIWARLGDPRAVAELEQVFRHQRASGFVPHVGYQHHPPAAVELWGVEGSSTITQPPMYAHAARRLVAEGFEVPADLVRRIEAALDHLWHSRLGPDGLLSCFHPWEAGTDDSPRWDAWTTAPFDRFGTWRERKLELVDALELDAEAVAIGSAAFVAQPASFNAITAFNLEEFAELTGSQTWRSRAGALREALEERWDRRLATWTDAATTVVGQDGDVAAHDSGAVRTLEALLGVLVTRDRGRADAVFGQLFDAAAHGARYGPCGVHRDEPAFDPDAYWRGANWPQLDYLLWVAAHRQQRPDVAARLGALLRDGARVSNHAEYWNPDTGAGRGATPQSWTALWLVAS